MNRVKYIKCNYKLVVMTDNPLKSKLLIRAGVTEPDDGLHLPPGAPYGYEGNKDITLETMKIHAIYDFLKGVSSDIAKDGDVFGGEGHGKYLPEEIVVYTRGDVSRKEFSIRFKNRNPEEGAEMIAGVYGDKPFERIMPGDEVLMYEFLGEGVDPEEVNGVDRKGYRKLNVEESSQKDNLDGIMDFVDHFLSEVYGNNQSFDEMRIKSSGKVRIGNGSGFEREASVDIYGRKTSTDNEYTLLVPEMWYNSDI